MKPPALTSTTWPEACRRFEAEAITGGRLVVLAGSVLVEIRVHRLMMHRITTSTIERHSPAAVP